MWLEKSIIRRDSGSWEMAHKRNGNDSLYMTKYSKVNELMNILAHRNNGLLPKYSKWYVVHFTLSYNLETYQCRLCNEHFISSQSMMPWPYMREAIIEHGMRHLKETGMIAFV